jgi:hypothetical protein
MHATTISMYYTDLRDKIIEAAKSDQQYEEIRVKLQQGILHKKLDKYELKEDGILMFRRIVYVPDSPELKNIILKELHNVPYLGTLVIKRH